MPFYAKYVKDGATIVEELQDCQNRRDAVSKLVTYKEMSDNGRVSLTSDSGRLAQWQELVRQEEEITPRRLKER